MNRLVASALSELQEQSDIQQAMLDDILLRQKDKIHKQLNMCIEIRTEYTQTNAFAKLMRLVAEVNALAAMIQLVEELWKTENYEYKLNEYLEYLNNFFAFNELELKKQSDKLNNVIESR